jgi:hypothetical protein
LESGKLIEEGLKAIFHIKDILDKKGTITLEGILIFPLVLFLLMYFIQISNYSRIHLALISTTAEVTREVALNWPIINSSEKLLPTMINSRLEILNQLLIKYKFLNLNSFKDGLNKILLLKLIQHYSDSILDLNKIEVVEMKLPNNNNEYFYVKLKYKTKIYLPFKTTNVEIFASSSERVWK